MDGLWTFETTSQIMQHQKPLQQFIFNQLFQSHCPRPGSWQVYLKVPERASTVLSVHSAITLAQPSTPDQQALSMAFWDENNCFVGACSKDDYFKAINGRLHHFHSMCNRIPQPLPSSATHTGSNPAHVHAGATPQTFSGYNQGQNVSQQPLPPRPPPILGPQNPSSMAMGDFSFRSQVQPQITPQNIQGLSPEGQQSQHVWTGALRQCRTPEGEAGISSHDEQTSHIQALPMERVQGRQGEAPRAIRCLQGEDGSMPTSSGYSANTFYSTPSPPVTVCEATPPATPPAIPPRPFKDPESPAKKEWERQKGNEGAENEFVDKLMELVGLEKVKRQVLEIRDKIEVYEQQGADVKGRFNAVFQGNPGTGKTTVARLYAGFLHSINVLESDYVMETSGTKLAAAGVVGAQRMLDEITELNDGGVLFVDEAYQLVAPHVSAAGRQVLDLILTEMENNVGKLVVVFVGYAEDMERLFEHNPGLASRVPYTLHFDDFSDEELWRVLCSNIDKAYSKKMKVEGTVDGLYMRVAIRRLGQGRGGRGFGNARAVENLLAQTIAGRQAKRLKAEKSKGNDPDMFLLARDDLLGPDSARFQSAAWTQLQGMIGLESVKQSVRSMIDMVDQNNRRELAEIKPSRKSLNQVFVGSPGTGKTTVAKLYGRILADLGLLSKGDVVIKNPSDFVGDCVGKSEANTRAILAATAGKVLIIDEAYMLDSGGATTGSQQDSYKTGVIDTLVAEVQGTLGDDRCIILAGYEDKMRALFDNGNPGLARRFPIESAFRFEDFDIDQLMQVLELKMREQDLRATEGGLGVARGVLGRTLMRPAFSNGGEVERCLAAAMSNYAARQAKKKPADRELYTLLEAEDFDPDHGRTAEGSCRKMLEGRVDEAIIDKLDECQQVWQLAKQRGCDPHELVPTKFVFKGAPGTGKTTAARSMGQMFYDLGLLATNEVVECSATDLIGQYVGQTAAKAREQLSKARGKVLVIDEAHRLRADANAFAAEAVDELLAFLGGGAHHRRQVVVLADRTAAVDALMASAPALAGLFPDHLVFAGLAPPACVALLARELARHAVLPAPPPPFLADPLDAGYAALAAVFEELRALPSWGNARDVGTLAEQIARKHMLAALRSSSGGDAELTLDVVEACAREMLRTQSERCGRAGVVERSFQQERLPMQTEIAFAAVPPPPVVRTAQAVDEEMAEAVDEAKVEARVADGEDEDEDEGKDERSEQDTQALLCRIGKCVAGFEWRKEGSGWRCKGGSHFVTDAQLRAHR